MSRHSLTGELPTVSKPLIPQQKPGAGRKRADDRQTLNGIPSVLKTPVPGKTYRKSMAQIPSVGDGCSNGQSIVGCKLNEGGA